MTVSYTHLDVYKRQYLDYEDNELNPDNVTSATGEQLRNRLKRCKCLALSLIHISICEAGDRVNVIFLSNRRKGNYEYNI